MNQEEVVKEIYDKNGKRKPTAPRSDDVGNVLELATLSHRRFREG